jgi:hypothetical protein
MLDKVAPEPKKAKTSGTMFATPCAKACLGQLGERAQRTQALPSDPDDCNTTPPFLVPSLQKRPRLFKALPDGPKALGGGLARRPAEGPFETFQKSGAEAGAEGPNDRPPSSIRRLCFFFVVFHLPICTFGLVLPRALDHGTARHPAQRVSSALGATATTTASATDAPVRHAPVRFDGYAANQTSEGVPW